MHPTHTAPIWNEPIETYIGTRCTLWEAAFGRLSPLTVPIELDDFVIESSSPFNGSSLEMVLIIYRDYVEMPSFKFFCKTHASRLTGKQVAHLLPKWRSNKTCPICSRTLLVRLNTRSDLFHKGSYWKYKCPVCDFSETVEGDHMFDCKCIACNTPKQDNERQHRPSVKNGGIKAPKEDIALSTLELLDDLKRENLALKTALKLVSPGSGQAFADLLQGYVFDKMSGTNVTVLLKLLDHKLTIPEAEAVLGVKRL